MEKRAYYSNRVLPYALLAPQLAVPGTVVQFRDDAGTLHRAVLREAPFYDPQNLRQKPECA